MDSDPPGPGGNANIPPGSIPSAPGGVQQMDQLGQPKMGQSQMGQGNPDVKTEDVKSEVSGGENSQEPIYEETERRCREANARKRHESHCRQSNYEGTIMKE